MINKKIVLLFLIILIFTSCGSPVGISTSDALWKMESIRSETMNFVNDYCLLYKEFNKTIYDKKSISINDVEYVGSKIYDFLKSKGIKVNTKYLNDTIEKAKINEKENLNFINNLKKQETENNYKNCDYLIIYDIWNGIEGKHSKTHYTALGISVFDIRRNETTSDYLISGNNHNFIDKFYPPVETFIDRAFEIWWKKYQE